MQDQKLSLPRIFVVERLAYNACRRAGTVSAVNGFLFSCKGSNLNPQSQNLMCYHYTTGKFLSPEPKKLTGDFFGSTWQMRSGCKYINIDFYLADDLLIFKYVKRSVGWSNDICGKCMISIKKII